jgi:hypothetical protein
VLNRKDPDLNDLTVIELAYNSDNKVLFIFKIIFKKFIIFIIIKDFLSHPCCQKWITKKFYGSISIRELNLGLFEIPTWMKVIFKKLFCNIIRNLFKILIRF